MSATSLVPSRIVAGTFFWTTISPDRSMRSLLEFYSTRFGGGGAPGKLPALPWSLRELVTLELFAQLHLQKLTGSGAWDLVYELDRVWELPLGEVAFEVGEEILRGGLLPVLEDHNGQGALVPLFVRYGDNGGLGDGFVAHNGVLQVHRGDPLPTRLHEILVPVPDLDVAPGFDGHDIPGLEPAVFGELVGAFSGVEVAAGDPGSAHLELAHLLAVPGDEAFVSACPNLDEGQGEALLGPVLVLLLFRGFQ